MPSSKPPRRALIAVLCAVLASCGGGGGGGPAAGGAVADAPPPPTAPTATADALAAEAERSWGADVIRARPAYDSGIAGWSTTVAVVDTGIDLDNPEFAGALHPASRDMVASRDSLQDVGGHGTKVAGVLAARRNGAEIHGIAYDARIMALRADGADTCPSDCRFPYVLTAAAIDHAVAGGADIVNLSFGAEDAITTGLRQAMADAAAAGRITVAAAGNSGGADPVQPALFAADPRALGLVLAVGAVDAQGTIAGFSNRAGAASEYYLVAPGVRLTTTRLGGGTASVSGTSFAAPHVAGAAALLLQAAPYLTGGQVVDLLLSTAIDLGEVGTDAVYGRGLVDVERALRPVGTASVPTGATLAAGGAPLASTDLVTGGALGDALAATEALSHAVFVDSYGRTYGIDLKRRISPATSGPDLREWLIGRPPAENMRLAPGLSVSVAELAADSPELLPEFAVRAQFGGFEIGGGSGYGLDHWLGLGAGPSDPDRGPGGALANPFLGLADSEAVSAAQSLGGGWSLRLGIAGPEDRALAAELRRDFAGGGGLGLQLGRLSERRGPLGSRGGGALAAGESVATDFLALFGRLPLTTATELLAGFSLGRSEGARPGGLITEISPLTSTAMAVGLTTAGPLGRDRLDFAISRPLRVRNGWADLAVPVARTMDGRIVKRSVRVDLVPGGLETDLAASYGLPLGEEGEVRLEGLLRFEPGHVADADPEGLLGMRYRVRW